jgi:nicotinamide mononucleotide transporter
MKNKQDLIISILSLIISIISGIISHDLILGGSLLLTTLLSSYFSSEGRSINYLFSFINCILIGYVGIKNGLYGYFIFYIFIFAPLQIIGYYLWHNHKDKHDSVIVRGFDLKNSIIIISSCIMGSLILAYLLSLIPTQKLAFLDASSVILNLCAFVLMMLRYKECWILWLSNNVIDLSIWIINFYNNGSNSFMMLLVSISYLLINIYGIIKWQHLKREG